MWTVFSVQYTLGRQTPVQVGNVETTAGAEVSGLISPSQTLFLVRLSQFIQSLVYNAMSVSMCRLDAANQVERAWKKLLSSATVQPRKGSHNRLFKRMPTSRRQ